MEVQTTNVLLALTSRFCQKNRELMEAIRLKKSKNELDVLYEDLCAVYDEVHTIKQSGKIGNA